MDDALNTMMNVARIRGGHGNDEWATICWIGWQAKGIDGQPRECGEILIHSSFGSWAHSWGHLGIAFDKWLQEAERDYCAVKFMGAKAYKFDGEKTVRELRRRLIDARRHDGLSREEARGIWDYVEDRQSELEASEHDFVNVMTQAETELVATKRVQQFISEPWEFTCTSLDNQFAGFWRDLWPVFVEHLKARPA